MQRDGVGERLLPQQQSLFLKQAKDFRARRRDAQAGEVRDLGRDFSVRQ